MQNDKAILGVCPVCDGTLRIMYSPLTKKMFVGCTNWSTCKVCGLDKSNCKCVCPKCGKQKGTCKCSWREKDWKPSCTRTYPLPGNASIQRTGNICDKCKTPIIMVYRKSRRPFKMCLDPECETKADWDKPRKRKKLK